MKKSSPEVVYKELLKGKPVALVMEHELRGVTPEMLDWRWDNIDNNTYKLWNPQDHVALEWQIPPSQVGHAGAIHMVCEKISDIPANVIRIRWEEPSAARIPTIYSHVNVGSAVHEHEKTSYGTRMRSTFLLPSFAPQEFLDSLRKHNIAEMGRFSEFQPQL